MDTLVPTARPSVELLEQVHRRRRRSVHLEMDRGWLEEITPSVKDLLSGMSKSGLLLRAGEGRYVLGTPGRHSLLQNVPAELLIDLLLRPRPYYVGFLSALIAHKLTDLHSTQFTVGVLQGTRVRGHLPLDLRLVQISPSRWPESDEIQRIRAVPGTKEFVTRSSLERSLVDALARPDLCAGFETVASVWRRALDRPEVSWNEVALISQRQGDAISRRAAFLMKQLGLDEVVDSAFGELVGRKTSTLLDRSDEFGLFGGQRDPSTGVVVNVPPAYLRGWLKGELG